MNAAAKQLNTTPYKLKRLLEAYWNGGEEALKQMQWGSGAPLKKLSLTDAQISKIVARETLTAQAHLSL